MDLSFNTYFSQNCTLPVNSMLSLTNKPNSGPIKPFSPSGIVLEANRTVYTKEKTPAEVIGELILLPLVNKMCNIFNGLSLWKYFPLASAAQTPYGKIVNLPTHFPSREVIIACFKKHAYTRASFSRERNFYEAVASHFDGIEMYKERYKIRLYVEGKYEYLLENYSYKEFDAFIDRCTYSLEVCSNLLPITG